MGISGAFALIYKNKVVEAIPDNFSAAVQPRMDWKTGLCEGLFDCHQCLHVCCCISAVYGKNLEKSGVMEYWPACAIGWFGENFPCIGACFKAYLTGQLKEAFGITSGGFCMDCCLHLWCPCCQVAREAKEIDETLGVEIECCFKVHDLHGNREFSCSDESE